MVRIAFILITFTGLVFGIFLNPYFWMIFRNAKFSDKLKKQLDELEED